MAKQQPEAEASAGDGTSPKTRETITVTRTITLDNTKPSKHQVTLVFGMELEVVERSLR